MSIPTNTIAASATAHIASYAAAIHSGRNITASDTSAITSLAENILSHYHHPHTVFALGSIVQNRDATAAIAGAAAHLTKLARCGVGLDIRMRESRVEAVSETAAVCWVKWEMRPAEKWGGGKGWEWTNVYGFRVVDGKGGWEWTVVDQEVQGFGANAPEVFKG